MCRVSRSIPEGIRVDREFSGLYPSKLLVEFFKQGKIDWTTYVEKYIESISDSEQAQKDIEEIRSLLDSGVSVNLLCYEKMMPCHRFLLGQLFLATEYEVMIYGMNLKFQRGWHSYKDGYCYSGLM